MNNLKKALSALPSGVDGILVSSELNQLYLTGFEFSDGYVLVTKNRSYLITDFRYIEAAKKEACKDFEIILFKGLGDGTVKKLIEDNNVVSLMYEDKRLTCAAFEVFKNTFNNVRFFPAGNLIEDLREYKSDFETECIVKAQRIAEKSLSELINTLSLDMTERDTAAKLEYLMKKNGAHGISFNTIAVSGKQSSLPHGVPRDVPLEKGFLTLDFGAVYKGYHSDMTRTFCIGKADDEMKKIYSTVLKAQNAAIDSIMSGERNCKIIDKISRDVIYGAGYEGCFGHGLGHGVGLEIHESPRLSPAAPPEKMLQTGHVVTVEPGIYIENKYGVRIEDMIFMSGAGPLNITKMPKELIEI